MATILVLHIETYGINNSSSSSSSNEVSGGGTFVWGTSTSLRLTGSSNYDGVYTYDSTNNWYYMNPSDPDYCYYIKHYNSYYSLEVYYQGNYTSMEFAYNGNDINGTHDWEYAIIMDGSTVQLTITDASSSEQGDLPNSLNVNWNGEGPMLDAIGTYNKSSSTSYVHENSNGWTIELQGAYWRILYNGSEFGNNGTDATPVGTYLYEMYGGTAFTVTDASNAGSSSNSSSSSSSNEVPASFVWGTTTKLIVTGADRSAANGEYTYDSSFNKYMHNEYDNDYGFEAYCIMQSEYGYQIRGGSYMAGGTEFYESEDVYASLDSTIIGQHEYQPFMYLTVSMSGGESGGESSSSAPALNGSGTQADPYIWESFIDNSIGTTNGCHTVEFSTGNYSNSRVYFRIGLSAGVTYYMSQTGYYDTYLYLFDLNGNQLISDDDTNNSVDGYYSPDRGSYVEFTPSSTGYYLIAAGGYNEASGTARLHVYPKPLEDISGGQGGNDNSSSSSSSSSANAGGGDGNGFVWGTSTALRLSGSGNYDGVYTYDSTNNWYYMNDFPGQDTGYCICKYTNWYSLHYVYEGGISSTEYSCSDSDINGTHTWDEQMMMAGDTADFTITDASSESGGGGGSGTDTGNVQFVNDYGSYSINITLNGETKTCPAYGGTVTFYNVPVGSQTITWENSWDIVGTPQQSVTVIANDTVEVHFASMCFVKGTKIRLSNGEDKPVEDITYDDDLLVWDFDNGCYASAKPAWIKIEETDEEYLLSRYSNGAELKTVGPKNMHHEIFNADEQKFQYTDSMVGNCTMTLDGLTKCISCELKQEHVKHYNIITKHHFNCFANGILTSCRLSKMYPIENMKYVKPVEARNTPSNLSKDIVDDYRLNEQPENIDKYVENFLARKK